MIDLQKHLINRKANILDAFRKLNDVPSNLTLFIINEDEELVGTLTDGDIRRGFLKGLQLTDCVEKFMTSQYSFLRNDELLPSQVKNIKARGVKLLPVINEEGRIIRVIDFSRVRTILPVDSVIMAGGRGERLRPLTDTVPKPMLKVGDKPILEHNLEHLAKYGIRNNFICVKYLHEQIESYFGNGNKKWGNITYVKEDLPLGTIGAMGLITGFLHDHILLMNADIFTDIDLEGFFENYLNSNSDMSVASVPYQVDVPYAVLNLENDIIKGFKEKPTYTYYSNAGIYLIKREMLSFIPENEFFNATDFIQILIDAGKKVTRFPILGYWLDIGKPEDFQKVQDIVRHRSLS